MESWINQKDQNHEPCTFIVSKSGSLWVDAPFSNEDKFDTVVGNGSISMGGDAIDLIVFISVTRNTTIDNYYPCFFKIEADANCDSLCENGVCKHGYGYCTCYYGWTGRFCNEKVETISILFVVIISVASCLLGITSTIICCWLIDRKRAKDRAFNFTPINYSK